MQVLVTSDPVAIPLLQRFTGIYVLDGSTISLPAALADTWPGCGGRTAGAGAAALKVEVRFDLLRGGLDVLGLQPGRVQDQVAANQTAPVPLGAPRLADLGFFSLDVLETRVAAGGHFLCRPKLQTQVQTAAGSWWALRRLLETRCRQTLDLPIRLGRGKQLPCRLLAERLPAPIVALRQHRLRADAQRERTTVSADQLALAAWTVLVTSVPADQLSLAEAVVLARLRWQVELLFKLWKRDGLVDEWRTAKVWRSLCAVLAKLLALLRQHWLLVLCCWAFPDKRLPQAAATSRAFGLALTAAFHDGAKPLAALIQRLQRIIASGCRLGRRRRHPYAYQLALAGLSLDYALS